MIDIKRFKRIYDDAGCIDASQKELDGRVVNFINNLMSVELSLRAEKKFKGKVILPPLVYFRPEGGPLEIGQVWRLIFNRETGETEAEVTYTPDGHRIVLRFVQVRIIENPCALLEYIQTCLLQDLIKY